jgi:hypothetical protein
MFWYKSKPCCDTLGQGYKTQYITEIIDLTENKQALAIIPLKTEGDKVDYGRGFSYWPASLSFRRVSSFHLIEYQTNNFFKHFLLGNKHI